MVITVWVQLLRGGENIGRADQIKLEDGSNVADLCDAVKVKYADDLNGISPARLNVSMARESSEYLELDQTLNGLQTSPRAPLFVHAPALAGGSEQVEIPGLQELRLSPQPAIEHELLTLFLKRGESHGSPTPFARASFKWGCSPVLDGDTGRKEYEQLRRSVARDESHGNEYLPGRQEQMRVLLAWADLVMRNEATTRHDVPVVSQVPGAGKTSLLLHSAEVLEKKLCGDEECRDKERPLVVMITYNAGMSGSLQGLWKDESAAARCAAVRILYGGLQSMGCPVLSWSELVDALRSDRLLELRKQVNGPAWALSMLRQWFGARQNTILVVDEVLKGASKSHGVGECDHPSDLARLYYGLMDNTKELKVYPILSAMSTVDIDTTSSNRAILPIYTSPLPIGDAVPLLLNKIQNVAGIAVNNCEVRATACLIWAYSSGHVRTMGKTIMQMSTKGVDFKARDQVLEQVSSALEDGVRQINYAHLEWVLHKRLKGGRKERDWLRATIDGHRVADLLHAGTLLLSESIGTTYMIVDVIASAMWTRARELPPEQEHLYPALSLFKRAIQPLSQQDKVADMAERVSMFMSAFALAHPDRAIRDAILPGLDSVLMQGGRAGWSGAGMTSGVIREAVDAIANWLGLKDRDTERVVATANGMFNLSHDAGTTILQQIDKVLQQLNIPVPLVPFGAGCARVLFDDELLVPGGEAAVKGGTDVKGGTAEKAWGILMRHLNQKLGTSRTHDGMWRVCIVATPPNCPVADYVLHFFRGLSAGARQDAFVAVQTKSLTGKKTNQPQSFVENKLKKALSNLQRLSPSHHSITGSDTMLSGSGGQPDDVTLASFVLHAADSMTPTGIDGNLPAFVVPGQVIGPHFPPSVLAFMSIVPAEESDAA